MSRDIEGSLECQVRRAPFHISRAYRFISRVPFPSRAKENHAQNGTNICREIQRIFHAPIADYDHWRFARDDHRTHVRFLGTTTHQATLQCAWWLGPARSRGLRHYERTCRCRLRAVSRFRAHTKRPFGAYLEFATNPMQTKAWRRTLRRTSPKSAPGDW
jgi:hypothetical protein